MEQNIFVQMTGIPLGVTNYNISSLLSSLPPLVRLAIQINSPFLIDQLSTADLRSLRSLSITGQQLKEVHPSPALIPSSLIIQIDTGAFRRLRGFDFDLSITRTNITSFQPEIFDTLTAIQVNINHITINRNTQYIAAYFS